MTNGFKEHEIVRVQGRDFPVIGGRLRIVHELNDKVFIGTELVDYVIDVHAVVRASVETTRGRFTATGTSSGARDPKLADSIIELAETRAVARALRYAGIGVECCGFEELGNGEVLDGNAPMRISIDPVLLAKLTPEETKIIRADLDTVIARTRALLDEPKTKAYFRDNFKCPEPVKALDLWYYNIVLEELPYEKVNAMYVAYRKKKGPTNMDQYGTGQAYTKGYTWHLKAEYLVETHASGNIEKGITVLVRCLAHELVHAADWLEDERYKDDAVGSPEQGLIAEAALGIPNRGWHTKPLDESLKEWRAKRGK